MPATIANPGAGKTPPKRIALFGLFGSGNSGNDGSLQAMLDFLRTARPDAEVTCICADPQRVAETFHIPALRIGRRSSPANHRTLIERLPVARKLLQFAHALRNVRNFDALVVPGTGVLDDFSERPWGFPASLLSWCFAARLFGAKVAFVSVGAGPIRHPLSRLLMKSAARMAHYRSYRDLISKTYMQSIGFDARHDAIYPDIAFKLAAPDLISISSSKAGYITVGVGVMTYYGWCGDARQGAEIYRSYIARLSRFLIWLLDQGHHVRILTGETSDDQAVADVQRSIASARPQLPPDCLIANPSRSLQDLMRQIAQTDAVVATRFHNVVCALKLGKPTISIGYAKKNDVLMAEMGLGDFCQHIESFDVDLLVEQFTALLLNRKQYERTIHATNNAYLERLREQDARLLAKFL